jgi:hypothetical protein
MAPDVTALLSRLTTGGTLLALKVYRLPIDGGPRVPMLPCLDHEAMLHASVAPHLSAYLRAPDSDGIHEVGIYPSERRLVVDIVSTMGEHSGAAHDRLLGALAREFPDYTVDVTRPSWWRGDRRVAEACRAQITLRDVLEGHPSADLTRRIERLRLVGALMEKESRVASWGVRTVTGPLLAAAGVILYAVLGVVAPRLGVNRITELQYGLIGVLGAVFLYYGLKAVQLTGMSNRVWKRASEYALILSERQRLGT